MLKTGALFVCVGLVFLVSCHLDYGKSLESKDLQKDVPDMVVSNGRFEVIRDKVRSMVLEVEKAEIFAKADKREMNNVSFTQYDREGNITAKGRAGHAVQGIQSEDVVFSGGLTVEIISQDSTVQADGLEWKSKEKILKGTDDQFVTITKKDGSSVKGHGFSVDFNTKTMELSGGVEGSLNHE